MENKKYNLKTARGEDVLLELDSIKGFSNNELKSFGAELSQLSDEEREKVSRYSNAAFSIAYGLLASSAAKKNAEANRATVDALKKVLEVSADIEIDDGTGTIIKPGLVTIVRNINSNVGTLSTALNNTNNTVIELSETVGNINNVIKETVDEVFKDNKEKLEILEANLDTANTNITNINTDLNDNIARVNQVSEEVESTREDISQVQDRVATAEIAITTADRKADEAKTAVDAANEKISAAKRDLQANIDAAKTGLETNINAIKINLNGDITTVRTDLEANINNAKASLNGDISTIRERVTIAEGTISIANEKVVEAKTAADTAYEVASKIALKNIFKFTPYRNKFDYVNVIRKSSEETIEAGTNVPLYISGDFLADLSAQVSYGDSIYIIPEKSSPSAYSNYSPDPTVYKNKIKVDGSEYNALLLTVTKTTKIFELPEAYIYNNYSNLKNFKPELEITKNGKIVLSESSQSALADLPPNVYYGIAIERPNRTCRSYNSRNRNERLLYKEKQAYDSFRTSVRAARVKGINKANIVRYRYNDTVIKNGSVYKLPKYTSVSTLIDDLSQLGRSGYNKVIGNTFLFKYLTKRPNTTTSGNGTVTSTDLTSGIALVKREKVVDGKTATKYYLNVPANSAHGITISTDRVYNKIDLKDSGTTSKAVYSNNKYHDPNDYYISKIEIICRKKINGYKHKNTKISGNIVFDNVSLDGIACKAYADGSSTASTHTFTITNNLNEENGYSYNATIDFSSQGNIQTVYIYNKSTSKDVQISAIKIYLKLKGHPSYLENSYILSADNTSMKSYMNYYGDFKIYNFIAGIYLYWYTKDTLYTSNLSNAIIANINGDGKLIFNKTGEF